MPDQRVPLTILLDCDGVLADFVTPALRALERCGGPRLAHDELDRYAIETLLHTQEQRAASWAEVTAPGYCASLVPYEGAAACVDDLRGMGHDVVCVTSPMASLTWAGERATWLRDLLGFDRSHIVSTSGKRWVRGDYLADDNDGHCETWQKHWPTGRAVLIKRSYNAGSHTLADFVEIVRLRTEALHV